MYQFPADLHVIHPKRMRYYSCVDKNIYLTHLVIHLYLLPTYCDLNLDTNWKIVGRITGWL